MSFRNKARCRSGWATTLADVRHHDHRYVETGQKIGNVVITVADRHNPYSSIAMTSDQERYVRAVHCQSTQDEPVEKHARRAQCESAQYVHSRRPPWFETTSASPARTPT